MRGGSHSSDDVEAENVVRHGTCKPHTILKRVTTQCLQDLMQVIESSTVVGTALLREYRTYSFLDIDWEVWRFLCHHIGLLSISLFNGDMPDSWRICNWISENI